MILWILLAIMTLAVLGLILWPMLGRGAAARARRDYDLAVYRDQLTEIDRDVARGLLTPAEAEAAKIEIQRRMLAAGTPEQSAAQAAPDRRRMPVAVALAVLLPAAGFALYGRLGTPGLPDQPFTERMIAHLGIPRDKALEMIAMVETLEARMRANPGDAEGWRMLGRSYGALGRPDAAADAFRAAIAHGATDAETGSALGEALVLSAGGMVGPDARRAFEAAIAAKPDDARARFYLALGRAQAGDARGAIALWRGLAEEVGANSPLLSTLQARIAEVAKAAGLDAAGIAPERFAAAAPAPGAAAPMSADELRMIEGMVGSLAARLEADPSDFEGWLRLGRSYAVLDRVPESIAAWKQAIALRPQDVGAKLGLAEMMVGALPDERGPLTPALATLLREILALDPDQPDALFYLGQNEALEGRPQEARAHWQKLVGQLPEGSPARREVENRLRELPAAP